MRFEALTGLANGFVSHFGFRVGGLDLGCLWLSGLFRHEQKLSETGQEHKACQQQQYRAKGESGVAVEVCEEEDQH